MMASQTFKIGGMIVLLGLFLTGCSKNSKKYPTGIRHVIVIGVDGLSPDGLKKAQTPVLRHMMANGSIKWNVRTVLTSSSSQNWASMIMGAGPEQHGIISNDWEIDDHTLPPIVQETDGRFPTIFSVLKKSKPQAEIGAVYHWDGFGRLFQKSAVTYDKHFSTEDSTAADFIRYIRDKKPALGFVHFDHVDHAGHHGGHGTTEYYQAVAKTDSLIGQILNGIKKAGIEENTLVIVWSDHGGIGKGHGGATPQEAEIAGIFYGKKVRKGYSIRQQVYTYDLAATIAFALGITPPYAWTGRPVKAAFEGFPEPENLWLGQQLIAAPLIHPVRKSYAQAGGLYMGIPAFITMSAEDKDSQIYYTLDGTDPDSTARVYKDRFSVNKTTVVKARAMDRKGNASLVATAYFRVVETGKGHGLTTRFYPGKTFKRLPDFGRIAEASSWISPEFVTEPDKINGMLTTENKGFALQYEGFIQIDTPGKYRFSTQSDDGSKLFIDDNEVVDNDGNHGVQEETGSVQLTPGKHKIRVEYYNHDGGFWLEAFYRGPGITKQLIPADKLFIK